MLCTPPLLEDKQGNEMINICTKWVISVYQSRGLLCPRNIETSLRNMSEDEKVELFLALAQIERKTETPSTAAWLDRQFTNNSLTTFQRKPQPVVTRHYAMG